MFAAITLTLVLLLASCHLVLVSAIIIRNINGTDGYPSFGGRYNSGFAPSPSSNNNFNSNSNNGYQNFGNPSNQNRVPLPPGQQMGGIRPPTPPVRPNINNGPGSNGGPPTMSSFLTFGSQSSQGKDSECERFYPAAFDSQRQMNSDCRSKCSTRGNVDLQCIRLDACYKRYMPDSDSQRDGNGDCRMNCILVGDHDEKCQRLENCYVKYSSRHDSEIQQNRDCRDRCIAEGDVDTQCLRHDGCYSKFPPSNDAFHTENAKCREECVSYGVSGQACSRLNPGG